MLKTARRLSGLQTDILPHSKLPVLYESASWRSARVANKYENEEIVNFVNFVCHGLNNAVQVSTNSRC